MIDAAKAFVVPDELRVLSGPHREGVAGPGFTFDNLVVDLIAIVRIDPLNADSLFLIGAHLVVHHHVHQHRNVVAF